jgi:hypothetical protein
MNNDQPRLLQEGFFGYNLIAYDGRVWAADMSVGPIDFTNTAEMEDRLANGSLMRAATIDGAYSAVDRLLDRRAFEAGLSKLGTVIDEKFIALSSRLESGMEELACSTENRLSTTETHLEQRQTSLAQRLSLITPESDGEPSLIQEGYYGYNLIAYDGRVWAADMSVGPIDFANTAEMEAKLANGSLLRAATIDGAYSAVDRLLDRRAFEAGLSKLGTVIDEKFIALSSRLESGLEEVARSSEDRFVALESPRWRQWLGYKKNNGEI